MGLIKRIQTVIASAINSVLNRIEDPRETLDYSYEKQVDMLNDVKRGITELVTAKQQLVHQKEIMCANVITLEEQASEAVEQGNEALARTALEQKAQAKENVEILTTQIKELNIKQEKLIKAEKNLELKVDQFRTNKEMMKAQYSAAEANQKINDSLTGMGDDIGNVGEAMRRATDKTEQMNARGSAIEELVETGVLDDSLGDPRSPIDRELSKGRRKSNVDQELETLKKQKGK